MQYMFVLEGFLASWAIVRAFSVHSMSIGGVILFFMASVYIYYIKNSCKSCFTKRNCCVIAPVSVVLTVLYLISEYPTIYGTLTSTLFKALIMLVSFIGTFLLIFYTIFFLLWIITEKKTPKIVKYNSKLYRYFPIIAFIIILLFWLPWFLYSCPAIMTPDSINQLEQVLGMVSPSNHHPYIHTLTIKLFYTIGFRLFGTPNAGIATYILFQMAFLAFVASYLIKTIQLYQKEPNLLPLIIVLCFYACMPYNAVMSVTVWKDSFFGGLVLLFSTCLFRLFVDSKIKPGNLIFFLICAVMFCLYRSNGWYAFLVLTPVILISCFKTHRQIIFTCILVIILSAAFRGPLCSRLNIDQPDLVESLCIPIQQISRILVDDRELTDEEKDQILKVIDPTYIHELYAPDFADNIKELVRAGDQAYLSEHKNDYAKFYIKMGLKYPDEYFKAYVDQTYGYYNPSASYSVADAEGIIENDTGVYSDPVISSHALLKIREILIKLQNIVPVYGTFWSMGCINWFILILLTLTVAKQKGNISKASWIPFIPAIAIIFTLMLATPVATEFRYAFGCFYTLPLFTYLSMREW